MRNPFFYEGKPSFYKAYSVLQGKTQEERKTDMSMGNTGTACLIQGE
jgi:hypothetical protein